MLLEFANESRVTKRHCFAHVIIYVARRYKVFGTDGTADSWRYFIAYGWLLFIFFVVVWYKTMHTYKYAQPHVGCLGVNSAWNVVVVCILLLFFYFLFPIIHPIGVSSALTGCRLKRRRKGGGRSTLTTRLVLWPQAKATTATATPTPMATTTTRTTTVSNCNTGAQCVGSGCSKIFRLNPPNPTPPPASVFRVVIVIELD